MYRRLVFCILCLYLSITVASCGTKSTTSIASDDCVLDIVTIDGTKEEYRIKETFQKEEVIDVIEHLCSYGLLDGIVDLASLFEMNVKLTGKLNLNSKPEEQVVASLSGLVKYKLEESIELDADLKTNFDVYSSSQTDTVDIFLHSFTKNSNLYTKYSISSTSDAYFGKQSIEEKGYYTSDEVFKESNILSSLKRIKEYKEELSNLSDKFLNSYGYTKNDVERYLQYGYVRISGKANAFITLLVQDSALTISKASSKELIFSGTYQGITFRVVFDLASMHITCIEGDTGSGFLSFIKSISQPIFEDSIESLEGRFKVEIKYETTIDTSNQDVRDYKEGLIFPEFKYTL